MFESKPHHEIIKQAIKDNRGDILEWLFSKDIIDKTFVEVTSRKLKIYEKNRPVLYDALQLSIYYDSPNCFDYCLTITSDVNQYCDSTVKQENALIMAIERFMKTGYQYFFNKLYKHTDLIIDKDVLMIFTKQNCDHFPMFCDLLEHSNFDKTDDYSKFISTMYNKKREQYVDKLLTKINDSGGNKKITDNMLKSCIENRKIDIFNNLIDVKKIDINTVIDGDKGPKYTPLSYACYPQMTQKFLKNILNKPDIDVNKKVAGITPFMTMIKRCHNICDTDKLMSKVITLMSILINNGADITLKDDNGNDMIQILYQNRETFHEASKIVDFLIKGGIKVEEKHYLLALKRTHFNTLGLLNKQGLNFKMKYLDEIVQLKYERILKILNYLTNNKYDFYQLPLSDTEPTFFMKLILKCNLDDTSKRNTFKQIIDIFINNLDEKKIKYLKYKCKIDDLTFKMININNYDKTNDTYITLDKNIPVSVLDIFIHKIHFYITNSWYDSNVLYKNYIDSLKKLISIIGIDNINLYNQYFDYHVKWLLEYIYRYRTRNMDTSKKYFNEFVTYFIQGIDREKVNITKENIDFFHKIFSQLHNKTHWNNVVYPLLVSN